MTTSDPGSGSNWPAAWSPAQALDTAPHETSLLHTVLDSSTEWILVKDREFRIRYANRALLNGLGLTEADVIGRLDSDLVPYAEQFRAQDLAALAGHDVHAVTRIASLHNGGPRHMQARVSPARNEAGEVVGIITYTRDITSAEEAAIAADAREEALRTLIANAPVTLVAIDAAGIFIRIDGTIIGGPVFDPERAVGQSIFAYVDDTTALGSATRRALAGEASTIEFAAPGVWLSASLTPTFGPTGALTSVIIVAHDVTAAHLLRESATANEALLRAIVNASPDWVMLKDRAHRYSLVNEAFARAHGHTPEEMIGHPDTDFFPTELTDGFHADDDATFAGAVSSRDGQHASLPGGEFVIDEYKRPLPDGTGEITHIISYAQDVTARHIALQALLRSEAQLNEAQALAHVGSWRTDLSSGVTVWSDEVYRIFGLPLADAEPSYTAFRTFIHPDDFDMVNEATARASQSGAPWQIAHRLVRADGRTRWIDNIGVYDLGADGVPLAVRGVFQDITERVETEARAARAADLVTMIVNAAPLPILVIDHDGTILSANPSAYGTFGWESPLLVGQNVDVLTADLPDGDHDRYLAHHLATGLPTTPGRLVVGRAQTVRARRQDGTEFPIELMVSELPPLDGKRQFVGIVSDRTEAQAHQEQVARLQRLDALGTLTAGVAHDFNNLLTAIIGGIELTVAQPNDPRWLQMSRDAAQRASGAVKQLLRFSREEAPSLSSIQPAELIDATIRLVSGSIDRRISIVTSMEPALPGVHADRGQIEQVLLNLVLNARDAVLEEADRAGSGYTPSIAIGAQAEARDGVAGVSFTITDNGPGISEDARERIFDPFFTTKPVDRGTGLGLAIVSGIVANHSGVIDVRSTAGAGATFDVWLPASPDATRAPAAPATDAPAPASLRRRALVVDDEPALLAIAAAYLEASGYDVRTCDNGTDAIALANEPFDVVIVDLNMPPPDGWAVLAEWQARQPHVPVVIASGFVNPDEARSRGATVVISKPYQRDAIASAVADALANSR